MAKKPKKSAPAGDTRSADPTPAADGRAGSEAQPASPTAPLPSPPAVAPAASASPAEDAFARLYARVQAAAAGDPAVSYTAKLFERGRAKIAQKLGEEAVETVIELVRDNKPGIVSESADVLYHLCVAWVASGVRPEEVWAELARREAMSGLAEKASRKA